jgi:hypothetical protein
MPDKVEALGVLLVLLPGFACAYIVQFLAVRRKQSDLDKVIEALLFSLILYLLTLPFFGYTFPLGWRAVDNQHPDAYQIVIKWAHLAWLTGSSILFALLYSANINHDWIMSILRSMRITERTTRKTIWNDTFQEIGGMVQVGLSGERRLLGWIRYYSDEAEEASLFLESASWITKNASNEDEDIEQPIDGPGILLTKDSGIEYVMFLNWAQRDSNSEKNT